MVSVRHSRFLLVLGVFVVSAGCIGPLSSTSSGVSTAETRVIIGPDHGLPSDPGQDGKFVDNPPIARANASHIIVTGEIPGIGDLNCLGATGNVTTQPDGTFVLTIQSETNPTPGGCNGSLGFYSYQAFVPINGSPPERLRVQQVDDVGETRSWNITVA